MAGSEAWGVRLLLGRGPPGSGEPITCTVKDVLHIPQGEVHRVKITDPAGVIDL